MMNSDTLNSSRALEKFHKQQELEQQVHSFLLFFDAKVASAYRQALEQVPHLVAAESCISDFLAKERGNPLRAATRLAKYWSARKELFGEDRWLRPMTQTGTGALDPQDVALLRTGFMAFISLEFLEKMLGSSLVSEDQPSAIVLLDRSRLPANVSVESVNQSIARIIFYNISVFRLSRYCILQVAHRNCIGDVFFMDPEKSSLLDAVTLSDRQGVFVARAYEPPERRQYVDRFAKDSLESLVRTLQDMSVSYVAKNSSKATLDALVSHGIPRVVLPHCLGGSYDYTLYDEWIRSRLSVEEIMSAARPIHNSALAYATQHSVKKKLLLWPQKPTSKSASMDTASTMAEEDPPVEQRPYETMSDFLRRRNQEYSRRFQTKRRRKEAELLDQRSGLRAQNAMLKSQNECLEKLIAMANSVVEDYLDSGPADAALDLLAVENEEEEEEELNQNSTNDLLIEDEEILRVVGAAAPTTAHTIYQDPVHNR